MEQAGIKTISVEDVTGFPEILDGRVKTLNPYIHGGLLARRDLKSHMETLKEQHITPIDLVCVNLYPFKETIQKPDCTLAQAIENIDIGGPSMIRSAAKNYHDVTIVVDKDDYATVLTELKEHKTTTLATRAQLAAKAFRHTAAYDALIAQYLSNQVDVVAPKQLTLTYELEDAMVKIHTKRLGSIKMLCLRLMLLRVLNSYMAKNFLTITLRMLMQPFALLANLKNRQWSH